MKILLIEDNPGDARIFLELLRPDSPNNYEVTVIDKLEKAKSEIENTAFEVIFLDFNITR